MTDEGRLDPWFKDQMASNPLLLEPMLDFSPEILELARGEALGDPARPIAHVSDSDVDGVPIRIYTHAEPPIGLVVYFHGGGFVLGSIGIMDDVARELAHAGNVAVVSVGYRLAPEHPYPAALDDCERVTRWALANASTFDVSPDAVVVAGESAGGNLAAAVALRLRDAGAHPLAGQLLIYPATAGGVTGDFPSWAAFDGLVVSTELRERYWEAYSGGRRIDDDPGAVPLSAPSLRGLPPALVQLGGCDVLRDEGRAYAQRLSEDGVRVAEICYPGQPHGFVNMGFPIAEEAFADAGEWLRSTLAHPQSDAIDAVR